MGFECVVKPVTDYDMIKKMLLGDKELYDRISDDYTDIKNWNPKRSWWLGWFKDGECMALLSATEETAIVLNAHIHIPKNNRGKDSFKMGNDLLKFLCRKCDKRFVKINAKIPSCFPDVVKYAEKNGFEKEGIDKHSYIKNGVISDRIILGKVIR